MATSSAVELGDVVDASATVYRAFAYQSFRDRKKCKVRPFAYYRRSDHLDGISVGLSPAAAVAGLQQNYGYGEISVADVNALPYMLQVRNDAIEPEHALIVNVPPIDGTDAEREQAELIAGALARHSRVVTCDPYMPS